MGVSAVTPLGGLAAGVRRAEDGALLFVFALFREGVRER